MIKINVLPSDDGFTWPRELGHIIREKRCQLAPFISEDKTKLVLSYDIPDRFAILNIETGKMDLESVDSMKEKYYRTEVEINVRIKR